MPTTLTRFRDRTQAGRVLAARLCHYARRGDVVVLALPGTGLPVAHAVADALEARLEVPERAPLDLTGRTTIIVDEGLATADAMSAAIHAARAQGAAKVVVAVPVADPAVCADLESVADEVVCAVTPRPLQAVGDCYDDAGPVPLGDTRSAYDDLLRRAAGAAYVLIGEASHGTHEFYRERAELTKRLIADGRCTAVAVEADWPDAYRVNRFVRGQGDDATPEEALRGFSRFPAWMWRNTVVEEFVGWLRDHNDSLPAGAAKVGFYGVDLYSLHASMEAVIAYLDDSDPAAARRARERYACFDHFGPDPQVYAYETGMAGGESCEAAAVEQLLELCRGRSGPAGPDLDADEHFFAEQNARLVVDAERYYRSMFRGGVQSWNLRDTHMADTIDELTRHLGRTGDGPRIVVWEHNSHLGDNRATELGEAGQLNVGQLVRERHPGETLIVGFSTYAGTVTAASDWGGDAERKRVRRALAGSWEELLHEHGVPAFVLDPAALEGRRLQRAIGVIYRPETERLSHYFHARIAEQFDAVIHLDETTALEPLERTSAWVAGELPETYPSGV